MLFIQKTTVKTFPQNSNRPTIAAIATAAGQGAVGIVRISGSLAISILARITHRSEQSFQDRVMTCCKIVDAQNVLVDEALVVVMRAPRSYTGEDVIEIHGHGGHYNTGRLLRVVIEQGATLAEAGEFTMRAFLAGKLNLVEVEAIADIINASSERALRLAQTQQGGALVAAFLAIQKEVISMLATIEANIDFPEEGLEEMPRQTLSDGLMAVAHQATCLAETFSLGKLLTSGVSVALVGAVNAGKSSLFNALIGEQRCLVTHDPGTTRDFIEATVVWDGINITLIDTAGTRDKDLSESLDDAERQGIVRSTQRASKADLRLVVRVDGQEFEPSSMDRSDELWVQSKCDHDKEMINDHHTQGEKQNSLVRTSVKTGVGLDELRQAILTHIQSRVSEGDDGFVITQERQRDGLEKTAALLHCAAEGVETSQPWEIIAIDMKDAAETLAALLGERLDDAVLDAVFAQFCIGK